MMVSIWGFGFFAFVFIAVLCCCVRVLDTFSRFFWGCWILELLLCVVAVGDNGSFLVWQRLRYEGVGAFVSVRGLYGL
jgi:hypothetical protein